MERQTVISTRYTIVGTLGTLLSPCLGVSAQQLSLSRHEATVLVEPYAPNVVRVSLSLRREDALGQS